VINKDLENPMKLLQELLLIDGLNNLLVSEADEEEVPVEEVPSKENTPEEADPEEEVSDEETADEEPEDVGSVADAEGFEKSKDERYLDGKSRPVTLLTKDEELDGIDVTLQYVINPKTGSWSFRACVAGQSEEDMVEFDTGEDPSSLMKHLKKKKKISAHQAVEYLNPPANGKLEADAE
jgi:hypothetical protein